MYRIINEKLRLKIGKKKGKFNGLTITKKNSALILKIHKMQEVDVSMYLQKKREKT